MANAAAHVCRWLARLYELRGDYPTAIDWVRQGLEVLEGRETADAAEMLITAGLIYSRQGDYDSAWICASTALRIAERLDERHRPRARLQFAGSLDAVVGPERHGD